MDTTSQTGSRSAQAPHSRLPFVYRVAAQVLLYVLPTTSLLAGVPVPPVRPARSAPAVTVPWRAASAWSSPVAAAPVAAPVAALSAPVATAAMPALPVLAIPQAGGGSGTTHGVVVGQVLSDRDGLPLSAASVTGSGSSATTDSLGRYSLTVTEAGLVSIQKSGYTSVERVVSTPNDDAMALVDARLTPLHAAVAVPPSGGTLVDGRITVTVPAGALAGNTALHLTSLSSQALPGALPLGWTPVAAFDLRHSSGSAPTAAMSLQVNDLPSGALHLIKYSAADHTWVGVAPSLSATAGTLSTALPSEGGFALVVRDTGAGAPAVPVVGAPLVGADAVDLPPGIMGTATVDPPHISSTMDLATAHVTAQPPVAVPSGSRLEARIVETYTLRSGQVLTDERRYHDVLVFHAPGGNANTLTASLSLAPWRSVAREELAQGEIRVEIWSPRSRVRGAVGGSQAVTVASQGAQLRVPAGALAQDTAIGLQTVPLSSSLPTAAGLTAVAETLVDFSGKELTASADLSFEAPGGYSGGTWLVARFEPAAAGWAVVALAKRESGRLIPDAYAGLPGIRVGGRYALFHSAAEVGFIDGTIQPAGSGAVVRVTPATLPFVGAVRADGGYIVVAPVGTATVRADVPGTTLTAQSEVSVAARQTTHANLTLQGTDVVATVYPANAAIVPNSVQIEVTSPLAIDPSTVTTTNVRLLKVSNNAPVTVRFVIAGDERGLLVIPTVPQGAPDTQQALEYGTEYRLVASNVRTRTGVNLVFPAVQFRTKPQVSTEANKKALVFSFPDVHNMVTVSAAPGSYAPGTSVMIINETNGDVVSLTAGNDGAVSDTVRATLNDRFAIMITDPQGNETSYKRSQFYDAATGQTAVGSGGGVVDGPNGTELRIPDGATDKPIKLKVETFGTSKFPESTWPVITNDAGNPAGHFGGGLTITSTDRPTFKKEVDLAFPKPADAPEGAFYYVYRRITGPNGKVFYEPLDHAFVEGPPGDQKVVTASYPFPGYVNSFSSFGSMAGGVVFQTMDQNHAFLMWSFESLLPAKPLPGVIKGTVRRALWRPNVPGRAPQPPDYVPVYGAIVSGVDADGVPLISSNLPNPLVAMTQADGTFVLWDYAYKGGQVKVHVETTMAPLQTADVIAYEANAQDWGSSQLRHYRNQAEVNVLLPGREPPAQPPTLAVHVMQEVDIDRGPGLDPRRVRRPTSGIIGLETALRVGFDSNNPITSVHITGPAYDETFAPGYGVIPDPLPEDAPPEEMRRNYILDTLFVPPRAGAYTVEAEVVPPLGQARTAKSVFLVIAAGGTRRDPIYGEPPKIITERTVPRLKDDGTIPTDVQLTTYPSVQFTEPVRGFNYSNVTLVEVESGEVLPIKISGVGSDTFGAVRSFEDLTNLTEFTLEDSVTSITVKPRQGFRVAKRYQLTIGATIGIVDLDKDENGAPTPRELESAPHVVEFATTRPSSYTSPAPPGEELVGSPALFLMKKRLYMVKGDMRGGSVQVFNVDNPLYRSEMPQAPALYITPRIVDMTGDPESVAALQYPADRRLPPTLGKLLVVATASTNKSAPSSLVLIDVTRDNQPVFPLGYVSLTNSAIEGYITRVHVRGRYAYASTNRKGVQVVDLWRAVELYESSSEYDKGMARIKINRDGQGFGHDAVISTVWVQEPAPPAPPPPAPAPRAPVPRVMDLAIADLETNGMQETVAFTTGKVPLAIVRPHSPAFAPRLCGTSQQPLEKTLPGPPERVMSLISGEAIAYAKLGRREDGLDGRDIILVAGTGYLDARQPGAQPGLVFAVIEFMGINQPPRLLGMVPISTYPRRIHVYGETALIGSELISLSDLENPKSLGIATNADGTPIIGEAMALSDNGIVYSSAYTVIGSVHALGGLQVASLDNRCQLAQLITPKVMLPQILGSTYLDVAAKKETPVVFSLCRKARVTLELVPEIGPATIVTGRVDYTPPPTRVPIDGTFELGIGLHRIHVPGDLLGVGTTGKRKFRLTAVDVEDPSNVQPPLEGKFVTNLVNPPVTPPAHSFVHDVNVGRGYLVKQHTDFTLPGRHMELAMKRTFSTSGQNSESAMGGGWAWSFDSRLLRAQRGPDQPQIYVVKTGDGNSVLFETDDDSMTGATFTPQPGYHGKLEIRILQELDPFRNEPKRRFTFTDTANNVHTFEQVESPRKADDEWMLKSIKDPHQDEIKLTYDEIGRVQLIELVQGTTTVYTLQVSYEHAGDFDRIASVSCPALGIHMSYVYDDRGNLIEASRNGENIPGDSGPAAAVYRTKYDYEALPPNYEDDDDSKADPHQLKRITDPNGSVTEYDYDNATPDKYPLGEVGVLKVRQLGDNGVNPETVFDYVFTGPPHVTTVTDPMGNPTRYEMTPITGGDPDEEPAVFLTKVVRPLGDNLTLGWNAATLRQDFEENALGQRITYGYDAMGNVNRTTVSAPSLPSLITQYTYHPKFGKMTAKIEPEGGDTTSWSINEETGDIDQMINHAGTTIYTYDNGVLVSERAPNGNVTQYTNHHAATGKPQEIAHNGTTLTEFRRIDARGRVTREWASNGAQTDTVYDGMDRVRSTTRRGPPDQVTTTTYWPGGQPNVMTSPSGATTTYTLNRLNELSTAETRFDVNGEPRSFTLVTTYDKNGNKETETDARGVLRRHYYDQRDRLSRTEIVSGPSVDGPVGDIRIYGYDAVGNRLTETDSRSDLTTTYQYDAYSRMTTKILPDTQYTEEFRYDKMGRVTDQKDANGKWTYTQYDKMGRITRVERPENMVTITAYDDSGGSRVNKSEDFDVTRGLRTRYDYDGLDREKTETVTLEGPGGDNAVYVTRTSYDDTQAHTVTVETDRWTQTTQLDASGRPQAVILAPSSGGDGTPIQTDYTYDAAGNKETFRDGRRKLTSYSYDGLGRLISVTDATEENPPATYDYYDDGLKKQDVDRRGVVKTFEYDNLGRQTLTQVAPHSQMLNKGWRQRTQYIDAERKRIEYDALDTPTPTTYQLDKLGRVKTITDVYGNFVEYGYDGVNKTSEKDKKGNVTEFQYDGLNRLRHVIDPAPFNGQSEDTDYFDTENKIVVRDRRKRVPATKQLDPLGRVKTVTRGAAALETNTYDQDGNKTLVVDAEGRRTKFVYDFANRLVKRIDGEGSSESSLTIFRVDENGNVTGEQDERSRQYGVPWSTEQRFDALNRVIEVKNGEGHATTIGYDAEGNRTLVRVPLLQETSYKYDELGKLLSVTEPRGATVYDYDANRNQTWRTDPKGNKVKMEYDLLNRLTDLYQDPGGLNLRTIHQYDKNDNEETLTDPKGQTVVMTYDELDRLKTKEYRFAPTDSNRPWRYTSGIEYRYDPNNNLTEAIETVVSATTTRALSTIRGYDDLDRLESETAPLADGVGTKQVRFGYYKNGLRERVIADGPSGELSTLYVYDWQNRLKSVTTTGDTQGTEYTYHGDGLPKTVTYPNGVVETSTYDKADRLRTLTNAKGAAVISSYEYGYNNNDNRTSQIETLGGVTESTSYGYDDSNRLKTVQYGPSTEFPNGRLVTYGYDDAGNRETEITTDPSTNVVLASKTGAFDKINRLNALTDNVDPTQSVLFGWDANGNQTSKTVGGVATTFVFDVRDRMVEAHNGSSTNLFYQYDFEGRMVRSSDDQGQKQYVYDGDSRLVEYAPGGSFMARYEYGDRLIRLRHYMEGQRFYSFDALGSVTALTDPLGAPVAKYRLDAWGVFKNPVDATSSENRFGYTGYIYAPMVKLYFANARFYDPELGRFTSQDSYLGFGDDPPSLHRYLYAHGNPTRYTDPTGHSISETLSWTADFVKYSAIYGYSTGLDTSANMLTFGGWHGARDAYRRGEGFGGVFAGGVAGVANTVTFGGLEGAVNGYSDDGFSGVLPGIAVGIGTTMLPIDEAKVLFDPKADGWDKTQAVIGGTTKVAMALLLVKGGPRSPKVGLSHEINMLKPRGLPPSAGMRAAVEMAKADLRAAAEVRAARNFATYEARHNAIQGEIQAARAAARERLAKVRAESGQGFARYENATAKIKTEAARDAARQAAQQRLASLRAETGANFARHAERSAAIEAEATSGARLTGNKSFPAVTEFTPSTGRTYKVFQRGDINWARIRTGGDKRFRGRTNAEAARAGHAPQLNDGSFATLHHSQQSARGPWFEASTRYHHIANAKKPPLHPYRGSQHPHHPLGRGPGSLREDFQTIESPEYWTWREASR